MDIRAVEQMIFASFRSDGFQIFTEYGIRGYTAKGTKFDGKGKSEQYYGKNGVGIQNRAGISGAPGAFKRRRKTVWRKTDGVD